MPSIRYSVARMYATIDKPMHDCTTRASKRSSSKFQINQGSSEVLSLEQQQCQRLS